LEEVVPVDNTESPSGTRS